MFKIYPATHSINSRFPFSCIAKYDRATLFIKFCHSILFDGFMAADIQCLLYFIFNGKTVAIPSKPSINPLPFHRLIPWIEVFNRSRDKMSKVGKPRSKRRSVVEHILVIGTSIFYRLVVDVIIFPEFLNTLFHLGKICFRIDRIEHCWNSSSNMNKATHEKYRDDHEVNYRHFTRYIQSVLTIVSRHR